MGDPPSNEVHQLSEDHKTIREGILSVTMGWAALENAVATILESILGPSDKTLGFSVYFTPGNAETRFDIVDRTLRAVIVGSPHEPAILKEWKHLFNKLNSARQTRNKIIHGNIATVYIRGKNHARLTPPIFDFQRMAGRSKNMQLPGMSAHDVTAAGTRIWDLDKWVDLMYGAISAFKADDTKALQKTLLELAIRRQKKAAPQ